MSSRPFDSPTDPLLRTTVTPRDGARAAARARSLTQLEMRSEASRESIHLAAALGDRETVARLVAEDRTRATARGGPFQWDPLTHLAFSVFLGAPDRADRDYLGVARALLAAGADANTGFHDPKADPDRSFRSVLYAASAIARDADLTRLLLEHGADPNDGEVAYHAPEGYENEPMQALVASGRCTPETLATMLLRKCDWHDTRGVRWLLEQGADPALETEWTASVLQHGLGRDVDLEIIQLLLDHGADPMAEVEGANAVAAAARLGRGDVLDAMSRRGIPLALEGGDALLAAAARGHAPAARRIADLQPAAVDEVHAMAGQVLVRFAGNGNSSGLRLLLEIGLPVDARDQDGYAYHDIAPMSTALHAAAWRGHPTAVRALLAGGADPNAKDAWDRTPLMLAVKACVDSFWTDRRTPESVEALLRAGASPAGIPLPCGYDRVDALLSPR